MAEERNSTITTGAPWPVSIGAGVCLTLMGATTEAHYNTAQSDMTSPPEVQARPWQVEDVASAFRRHLTAWKAEVRTSASSKLERLILSEHYQNIIGMGPPVIPHILAEFEARPDHWAWALRVITGQDPVPAEAEGKLKAMARAWVDWGRARGLI
jgi:hypothetical protein